MEIELFMCRSDNYGVLIRDPKTGVVAAIDAPEATAIETALARRGWKLDLILITHRHFDHVEGIAPLVAKYGARVIAPVLAKADVPGADRYVDEGDIVEVGALRADVWATPGHCVDHVSYHFAAGQVIFVADVLFVMGCGRVLDSTADALHASVKRIAALPDATRIYCGHEYTLSNAKFCAHIEPDNAAIAARLKTFEAARAAGQFTVPTTVGDEKATNVFVRAANAAEFAARREAKNTF
ncbi:MAG: hydroxyacylglutathione [Beijerinckiaceae bacterium]|nr:MAG: hydroxyacylglutathione [Beijerinckiaceae bacterium]